VRNIKAIYSGLLTARRIYRSGTTGTNRFPLAICHVACALLLYHRLADISQSVSGLHTVSLRSHVLYLRVCIGVCVCMCVSIGRINSTSTATELRNVCYPTPVARLYVLYFRVIARHRQCRYTSIMIYTHI